MAGICAIALAVTYPGGQAVTAPAARAALAAAAGHWSLVAAAVTGAVALAMACTPVRGPAASWIMGKLTL